MASMGKAETTCRESRKTLPALAESPTLGKPLILSHAGKQLALHKARLKKS